jgi:putative Mn2+ efflux pump MntP
MDQTALLLLPFLPFVLIMIGTRWLHYLIMWLVSACVFGFCLAAMSSAGCTSTACVEGWLNVFALLIGGVLFILAAIGKMLNLMTRGYRERKRKHAEAAAH